MTYVCPMHPEVVSQKPGSCSKCGMDLVRKKDGKEMEMAHDHTEHHRKMAEDFKKRFFLTLPLTLLVLILSPQIQNWLGLSFSVPFSKQILFVVGTLIFVFGGKPFFVASKDELKTKNWGMMTLVSLAITTGYLFSVFSTFFVSGELLWWEISTLISVFLFGHWIEMRAVLGTSGSLKELAKLIPAMAHKIVGEKIEDVPTSELVKNDIVLIRPGEKIPTDGTVLKGSSSVNESMITGESRPVEKKMGSEVIGGSINHDGALTVKVTKVGKESAINQIITLVQEAQMTKPKVQKLADKAANYLTIIAIVSGLLTFFYWSFIGSIGYVAALTFAISVIVITCPHALGLAIPTVTTITSSLAAKNGILIKDMRGLETSKNLNYVVFDKTGTLTKGEFAVLKIKTFGKISEKEVLKLAASVEVNSEHSLANAIVKEAKTKKIKFNKALDFKSFSGMGAKAKLDGSWIIVGNEKILKENSIEIEEAMAVKSNETRVYVAKDKKVIGVILLGDELRKESKKVVDLLHKNNIKVAMLSGDKKETSEKVGKTLGIDTVFSEVLPKEKVEKIKELQEKGNIVAMVGDGVNDAPSLTQANVGIAIGAGTSVAVESAEIVLVKNNPLDVLKIINLSKKTDSKVKQNLVWATGYNAIAIPAAAGVFVGWGITLRPEVGALLMSASSLIVVANALLLKKTKI